MATKEGAYAILRPCAAIGRVPSLGIAAKSDMPELEVAAEVAPGLQRLARPVLLPKAIQTEGKQGR